MKSLRLNIFVPAVAVAVLVANAGLTIYRDYRATLTDHELMARDLVSVVADQTERSVQDTDLALRQVGEVVRAGGGLAGLKQRSHWEALRRIGERIPGGIAILVTDHTGSVVASSSGPVAASLSVADRDYMKVLADRDVLHVGSGVRSRIRANETIYTISRRISDASGKFIGVASAGISTSHLTDFYGLLGFRKNPLIVVYRANGDIMARRPYSEELSTSNIASSPLFQVRLKQAPEGVFRNVSPLDGVDRINAYKQLKDSGVIVLVGLPWEHVTAEWRDRMWRTLELTAVSALVIVLAALWGNWVMRNAMRAQADRKEALAAEEKARAALQHALRDQLTGLPSRALFLQEAALLLKRCAETGERMAVLLVDLDGFKGVNDTYGHEQGDAVLVKAAAVLNGALRQSDVAGRLGGDEFAICVTAPAAAINELASLIAGRIVERMAEIGLGIGCSVGVTISPLSCTDFACALRKADEAMYQAKRAGKNRFLLADAVARCGGPVCLAR